MPKKPPQETFPCPNCGAEVKVGSRSCPECGADDETGWSDETLYDGLDLPEREEEAGHPAASFRSGRVMTIAAVVLLIAFVILFIRRFV